MKMDLGQNNLEKSLLIFSEAKASWVYTRLAHKTMPNLTVCTLLPIHNCIKIEKSPILFIFIPLSSTYICIYIYIYLCKKKFLFIPLHLSLPGCTKPLYFRGHNDKPVGKQISKTNWWCVFHLYDSPKGANASFKSNWILISSLQGQMYHYWLGWVPHCIQQDDT